LVKRVRELEQRVAADGSQRAKIDALRKQRHEDEVEIARLKEENIALEATIAGLKNRVADSVSYDLKEEREATNGNS